ncbi:MAG: hypothetical protein R1F54_03070 [Candidatus Zeuxoniibacter abyssi]|nr:MAG: hypothetical protein R1F54_03070 [Candidatus Persebacteraceae bacterium AB1(2)]
MTEIIYQLGLPEKFKAEAVIYTMKHLAKNLRWRCVALKNDAIF